MLQQNRFSRTRRKEVNGHPVNGTEGDRTALSVRSRSVDPRPPPIPCVTRDAHRATLEDVVIDSFRHRGLKRLHEQGDRRQVPASMAHRLERVLDLMRSARSPQDLNIPGLKLHPLRGSRKGEWAVTITGNWRITFRVGHGRICDVDLVDYH